eukprot:750697-Hanusia_phi.AAC.2
MVETMLAMSKKARTLRKKLRQIETLKAMKQSGQRLLEEQEIKIASEDEFRRNLFELESILNSEERESHDDDDAQAGLEAQEEAEAAFPQEEAPLEEHLLTAEGEGPGKEEAEEDEGWVVKGRGRKQVPSMKKHFSARIEVSRIQRLGELLQEANEEGKEDEQEEQSRKEPPAGRVSGVQVVQEKKKSAEEEEEERVAEVRRKVLDQIRKGWKEGYLRQTSIEAHRNAVSSVFVTRDKLLSGGMSRRRGAVQRRGVRSVEGGRNGRFHEEMEVNCSSFRLRRSVQGVGAS